MLEGENKVFDKDKDADLNLLMSQLRHIRGRLSRRMSGLPDDDTLRHHLSTLDGETLRALVVSDPWDTFSTGGEEVDVDLLFNQSDPPVPSDQPVSVAS